MLIKEYRICMPMTVEEYRIAQLYMIQKKSREESTGTESGVEIVKNEPYENGPGGSGQYTFKIFHIGSHLPNWFRAILPSSALRVEEEAWNAYPYTKTKYRCPFIEKFVLEVETVYKNDDGCQNNIFNLSKSEESNLQVDYLDIVKDPIPSGEYSREEDPKLYVSATSGRGPLSETWRQDYAESMKHGGDKKIMCAYKLCRVEFRYWGMQSKIERFIHDVALRKTMLRAHRQAWTWQDEYHGLDINAIRALEEETMRALAAKMAAAKEEEGADKMMRNEVESKNEASGTCLPAKAAEHGGRVTNSEHCATAATAADNVANKKVSWNQGKSTDSIEWSTQSIETLQTASSDEEEFFDAEDKRDPDSISYQTCFSEALVENEAGSTDVGGSSDCGGGASFANKKSSCLRRSQVLLLLLHGGSLLDSGPEWHNKAADAATLRGTIESVLRTKYSWLSNNSSSATEDSPLQIRLVACPQLVTGPLAALATLSPYVADPSDSASTSAALSHDYVPLSAIPLFLTASCEYDDILRQTAAALNNKMHEFRALADNSGGAEFGGKVCIVADCLGGLLAYDLLTRCKTSCTGRHTRNSGGGVTGPDESGVASNAASSCDRSTTTASADNIEEAAADSLRLDFRVSDFFMLGCPLGLVLAYRRIMQRGTNFGEPPKPLCSQVYNLFHSTDPCAFRVEPLVSDRFRFITPIRIAKFAHFPLGDGQALSLMDTLNCQSAAFGYALRRGSEELMSLDNSPLHRQDSCTSNSSSASGVGGSVAQDISLNLVTSLARRWWGSRRLDYGLHCPEALQKFPMNALPHLLHASYWESNDVASFIIRQVIADTEYSSTPEIRRGTKLSRNSSIPIEKWRNRGNSIKLKGATPNHRANDILILEGQAQILTARFMYGPLDMLSLCGETIDVYCMNTPPNGDWDCYGSCTSDNSGRVSFQLPDNRILPAGMYPVKMVVRGDHSFVDLTLAILPHHAEIVVFSVDGSFAASVSLMGKDPKVRPGSVDVVRHWQELGYLLVYITARPDLQHRRVVSWLAQHNFPHGMMLFMDGLVADPMRQKTNMLMRLVREVGVTLHVAYGSAKDVVVYQSVGLDANRIFIVGKPSRKQAQNCVVLAQGYAVHLNTLLHGHELSRHAQGNTRLIIRRGCFVLPSKTLPNKKTRSRPISSGSLSGGHSSTENIFSDASHNQEQHLDLGIGRTRRSNQVRGFPAAIQNR